MSDKQVAEGILRRVAERVATGERVSVGFDVFDTLITRCIPKDLAFETTCRSVAVGLLGDAARHDEVAQAYQRAYLPDCERNVANGRCFEAFSERLFEDWAKELCALAGDTDAARLAEFVVDCEIKLLRVIPQSKWLLERLRDLGVEVFYASDMYLGREGVDRILRAFGLLEHFKFGVVSSDVAHLKRTGLLFDWLIREGRIDPARTVFVGDDRLADYEMPSARGIEARHYDLPDLETEKADLVAQFKALERGEKSIDEVIQRCLSGFAFENASAETVAVSKYLGLYFCNFAHAAVEAYRKKGVGAVLFAAREGLLLMDICESIEALHFRRSERALRLYAPASRLTGLQFSLAQRDFGLAEVSNLRQNGKGTLRNLTSFLSLSEKELQEIVDKVGLASPDAAFHEPAAEWSPFQRLVESINEHPKMAGARAQGELFLQYLKQQGALDGKVKLFVDLGWSGQIQEYIWKGLRRRGLPSALVGFYAGTRLRSHWRRAEGNAAAWHYADESHLDYAGYPILWFPQLLETLCRSPHGSCRGFELSEDGVVLPVWDSKRQRQELEDDALLARIQELILRYADAYAVLTAAWAVPAQALRERARVSMHQFLMFPEREIARCFVSFSNVSDLGSTEVITGSAEEGVIGRDEARFQALARQSLWPTGLLSCFFGQKEARTRAHATARDRWPRPGQSLDPGLTLHNQRPFPYDGTQEAPVASDARAASAYADQVDRLRAHRRRLAQAYAAQELAYHSRFAEPFFTPTEYAALRENIDQGQRMLDEFRGLSTDTAAGAHSPGRAANPLKRGLRRVRSNISRRRVRRYAEAKGLFDANFYLASNPDVKAAGTDPWLHFLEHGGWERRAPSAAFDISEYLIDNPDVAATKMNPLLHYINHGAAEGRPIRPVSKART